MERYSIARVCGVAVVMFMVTLLTKVGPLVRFRDSAIFFFHYSHA